MVAITRRQELVLAALAADGGAEFAPVQVQKLFFLIDENLARALGGRQFSFEPYDYGPFDRAVYSELESLARADLVRVIDIGPSNGRRRYALTPAGQEAGRHALAKLHPEVQEYLAKVSAWVRSLGFAQLVGWIYEKYPHMRVNSVFRG